MTYNFFKTEFETTLDKTWDLLRNWLIFISKIKLSTGLIFANSGDPLSGKNSPLAPGFELSAFHIAFTAFEQM